MQGIIQLKELYKKMGFTVSPSDYSGQICIIRVKDLPSYQAKNSLYQRQLYYKVSLVYGHSKIHFAETTYEINGSTLIFTNPKYPYKWEAISSEQNGYVCIFSRDFLSGLADPEAFSPFQSDRNAIIPLSVDEQMIIENQFTKMDEELKGDYALKFALLRHQLIELLYLAQKYNPNPGTLFIGSNSNERLAHSFFALLEAQFPVINLDQGLTMTTPGDFAMALHVHVNHLNKAIKSVTAMSTSAAINNRLMTESKNLLKATKWSITEIAYTLGFEESNHFSAFFKRHHGVSPARFRSHSD